MELMGHECLLEKLWKEKHIPSFFLNAKLLDGWGRAWRGELVLNLAVQPRSAMSP